MQVENLNEEQLKAAQELFNSFGEPVTHKSFPMDDLNTIRRLDEIENKLAELDRKFERTFGNHVLINGQFVDLQMRAKKQLKKSGYNHSR